MKSRDCTSRTDDCVEDHPGPFSQDSGRDWRTGAGWGHKTAQETLRQPKTGPRQLQDGPNADQDRTRQPPDGQSTAQDRFNFEAKNYLFLKVCGMSQLFHGITAGRTQPVVFPIQHLSVMAISTLVLTLTTASLIAHLAVRCSYDFSRH